MGLMEYLLIAVGAIAVAFLMVTAVQCISVYYKQRHNMSGWVGVFMLAIAAVVVDFSIYHYANVNIPRITITAALLLPTEFLDMRYAGVGMDLLALLFQLVLVAVFITVIVVAVILFMIRSIWYGDDLALDVVTGTTREFENGVRFSSDSS